MASHVLAIDLGTSGPKVGVVSTAGEVAAWSFRPVALELIPEGGAEQDPDEWWRAIVEAAHEALAQSPVPADRIAAVACTSQWSGTVAVGRDGRHLHNAIIWMDSRGAPDIADLNRGLVKVEGYRPLKLARWLRLTGGAPGHAGKDPIAHILWLRRTHPEVYEQASVFLEPKDFLNLRLTGRAAAGYDSITLHWVTDNRQLGEVAYDPTLLEMGRLDRSKLPDLQPAADVLGPVLPEVAAELGIPAGVPVAMGTPDVQSAGVGSGAVRDFEGHLYLGTSSWLSCHVPFKKTDLFHNMASLPSPLPGRYFLANEQEAAGACLTWLAEQLGMSDESDNVYAGFDRVAERVEPGSGGVLFTPWLYGERTPVDNRHLRATFFNQSLGTTRDHLIRAVFEGVAFNSRWLLRYVEKFIGKKMEGLRVVGGGARSAIWCQIHADVLGRTVHQVEAPILTGLRGVALLAGLSLGEVHVADVADQVRVTASFEPDPSNRELYDRRFAEFLRLYGATRRIHARMNGD